MTTEHPGPSDQVRRTVLYTGDVQGVGFRYTTRRIAQDYRVTGFVRNLSDGRVELVAEGFRTELEGFMRAIESGLASHIREVDVTESSATGAFDVFDITL